MIYRFSSSTPESVLDAVLAWSWYKESVEMWRGRCDAPGQYRFDWRIRVEGRFETEFLLRWGAEHSVLEQDYVLAESGSLPGSR
jgi:hypothetical protein